MNRKRNSIALLLALALSLVLLPQRQVSAAASGACLIEAKSRRVLAAENEHERMPMASTTKVMTALIAIENGRLDELVEIDDKAVGVEGSSMYLRKGESLSLIELLYGLMLPSGNDAAVAIAIHIAGSVEAFADMMNERAKSLGCNNTHFINPNGLHDDSHYTSAYDLALICAEAMGSETFALIVQTQYHVVEGGATPRTLKNKNRLLWSYEGGNGIKTGYTKRAGKCLTFAAEREGMQLVGAVLNHGDMWEKAVELLDSGFNNYCMQSALSAESPYPEIVVKDGVKKTLPIVAQGGIILPLRRDGSDKFELVVNCVTELTAPITAGQDVGTITVLVNGVPIATVALVSAEAIDRAGPLHYFKQIAFGWLS